MPIKQFIVGIILARPFYKQSEFYGVIIRAEITVALVRINTRFIPTGVVGLLCWQLAASSLKLLKRLTKTAKWSLIGAGIKEVLMGATPQNINDVRITIKDCRMCNAWDRINPVLNELYRTCQAYNRDSHKICQSIEPDESAIREINAAQLHKQAAKAQALVNKLRGMGVHFVDLRSFDLFSKAFCQAMVMEFGERGMRVAAY